MGNKKFRSDRELDTTAFRKNFRALLDGRGMTPTDFARAVDMAPGTITRYFYERTPDIVAVLIICDYFNVSIDWLLGRYDNKYYAIPEEVQTVADRYQAASASDKLVVDTLLEKYAKQ